MKRRILLIAPPFYRLMGSHYNGLHLGIAYIAAVLKSHGHQVKVYNADYCDANEYLNQAQLFNGFAYYKEVLSDHSHPIWSEIEDKISGFMPDFLGITMLTANYKAARNIAGIAKTIDDNIRVVVGGTHPTLDPEGTLAETDYDYLIRGEGEFSFLDLADGREDAEIEGLSYKRDNKPIHNRERPFVKDLDIFPFPSRDSFLNDTKYLDFGHIITGRGCPFSCAYCASPQFWQRTVRLRSVSNVIEEMEYLQANYHSYLIHFADDTFTMNKNRAKEICQQLIDKRMDVKWVCDTRADCLDQELVTMMKKAGCIRVKLGAESGCDRILASVRKGITKEIIRKTVNLIKEQGLQLTVYFMAGFPGETNENLLQTIEFAKELEANYYSLSILAPYYGTQIWNDLEKSGRMPDKEHWEYFYHQNQEMLFSDGLDPDIVSQFLALDKLGRGERV
ncbi:B12-binding domain-containing radical SAM protein [Chloroflexota bacterium]